MICILKNNDLDSGIIWSLGEPLPVINPFDITCITAEGKELDLILKYGWNIPHTEHWLQVWFGDTAKFIFRALGGIPGMVIADPKPHSVGFKKVFEGIVEDTDGKYQEEDSGQALIATIFDEVPPSDDGVFVRIQSWDETCKHVEARKVEGKRVRVTIEEV